MQILIPILIFIARVADVSLGTIRIIFVSRGLRILAAIFGFFEILIWLLAISQIMHNLTNVVNYIAYAAGFAMGNFVGISIEKRLFAGSLMLRIVVKENAAALMQRLTSCRYGVTSLDGQGIRGPVKIIFTVIDRKNLKKVIDMVKDLNPNAFYTIEDIRFVNQPAIFPLANTDRTFFHRFYGSFQKRK